MIGQHDRQLSTENDSFLMPALSEPRSNPADTNPNHEKCVAEQLGGRAVELYVPLYSSIRRWKDRRVTLHADLFRKIARLADSKGCQANELSGKAAA
jgi:hypothetical protein